MVLGIPLALLKLRGDACEGFGKADYLSLELLDVLDSQRIPRAPHRSIRRRQKLVLSVGELHRQGAILLGANKLALSPQSAKLVVHMGDDVPVLHHAPAERALPLILACRNGGCGALGEGDVDKRAADLRSEQIPREGHAHVVEL